MMPSQKTPEEVLRGHARQIFDAALRAVDPQEAIRQHARLQDGMLLIDGERLELDAFERIYVVGAGKATAPMAQAIETLLGDRITDGAIVVKEGHGLPLERIKVIEGGHPVPTRQGVEGTETILAMLAGVARNDLVLCLISGGGSALMVAPADGLTLTDKQDTTQLLLASGAAIHDVNTVRKHLSRVKGGQLAQVADPATVISLILSDVVGDDLGVIASGPTVADSSTFEDALHILRAHGIWDRVPRSVRHRIRQGIDGEVLETPDGDHEVFERCDWVLVGSNLQALEAAAQQSRQLGYRPLILSSKIEGEAREVAKVLAAIARELHQSQYPVKTPACILCGGETTVVLKGDGMGGRNQELALALAMGIDGLPDTVVLCGGTDGTDGPTDAAGAVVDGRTVSRARSRRLDPHDYLYRNDSHHFFRQLDDLIVTGPTRTNVMDVYLLLVGNFG